MNKRKIILIKVFMLLSTEIGNQITMCRTLSPLDGSDFVKYNRRGIGGPRSVCLYIYCFKLNMKMTDNQTD